MREQVCNLLFFLFFIILLCQCLAGFLCIIEIEWIKFFFVDCFRLVWERWISYFCHLYVIITHTQLFVNLVKMTLEPVLWLWPSNQKNLIFEKFCQDEFSFYWSRRMYFAASVLIFLLLHFFIFSRLAWVTFLGFCWTWFGKFNKFSIELTRKKKYWLEAL